MPVLAMPAWRARRTQPIAIDDIVECLVEARNVAPGAYEVAGPDTLTFEEMTKVIADLLGETHRSIPMPFSNSRFEAAAAALVTDQDRELLEPLMAGLDGDPVVRHNSAHKIFGVQPMPFRKAAGQAIAAMSPA